MKPRRRQGRRSSPRFFGCLGHLSPFESCVDGFRRYSVPTSGITDAAGVPHDSGARPPRTPSKMPATTPRKPLRRRLRAWRHRRRDLRRIQTALASPSRPIVLVHQMGKVGSRSVRFVLADMGEFSMSAHWCNEANLAHRAGIIDERCASRTATGTVIISVSCSTNRPARSNDL